jgi:hypothetical protein
MSRHSEAIRIGVSAIGLLTITFCFLVLAFSL